MRNVSRCCFGILLATFSTGCVERRMTVRSEPSNALVILDGQEIGFTPISVPFHYYGVRQIKLVKDGYETKVINQPISTPWYEWLGVDFVSEVLVPTRIRDERNYDYALEPKLMVPQDQFMQRAEEVRIEAQNPPPRALKRAKIVDETPEPVVLQPASLKASAKPDDDAR